MKNTIILFDLDGTLIDSTEAIIESFGAAYEQLSEKTPNPAAIKRLIGRPLEAMFVALGVHKEHVTACAKAYREHYRTVHTLKTTLLPGADEAIKHAAMFAYIGIVTTKNTRFTADLLKHFGLIDFFDSVIGQNDVRHPKPHPEPIHKALAALPTVTGRSYMIGDTCLDMEAAEAANIEGMGVLDGYSDRTLLSRCTGNLFENASEAVRGIAKKEKTNLPKPPLRELSLQ